MELLGLSTLLLLIYSSYGDNITALSTGLVDNPLSTTAVIDVPSPCLFSGKAATLYILNVSSTTPAVYSLTVPQCRLKRELIVVSDPQNGNTPTINVGYLVTGLSPSTAYSAWYDIGGTVFSKANFTTKTILSAPPIVFARSGGMVVITVILSIAMFLLVAGLIAVLVLSARGKK